MSNFLAQYIVDFATFLPSEESVRGVIADASRLTSGLVDPERLGPNPSSTKVLLGNNTWEEVSTILTGELAPIAFSGSASDLSTGTVPLLRLPSEVARKDLSNIFLQGNTFQSTQVFEASICVGVGGIGPRIRQGTGQVFSLNTNDDTARAGLEVGNITSTGTVAIGLSLRSDARLYLSPTSTSNHGIWILNLVGQTGAPFRITDNGGVEAFSISPAGNIYSTGTLQLGGTAGHLLRWNAGTSSLEVRDSTNSWYRKIRAGELQVVTDLGGSYATPANVRIGLLTQIGSYIAGAITGRTYSSNAAHGDVIISASSNITTGQNDYSGQTDDLVIRGNTGDVEINRGLLGIGIAAQSARSISIIPANTANRTGVRVNDFGSFANSVSQAGFEIAYLGGTFSSPSTPVVADYRNLLSFKTGGTNGIVSSSPSFCIRSIIGSVIGSSLSEVNTSFMITPTGTGTTVSAQTIYGNSGLVDFPIGQIQLGTNVRLKNNSGSLDVRNSGDTDWSIVNANQYRLANNTFSRVAQINTSSGAWGGGYNFNFNGNITNRDSTGTVNAVVYNTSAIQWFSESSAAAGTISPKMTLSVDTLTVGLSTAYGGVNMTAIPSATARTGYFAWFKSNGSRQGYFGYDNGNDITLIMEQSGGNFVVNTGIKVGGSSGPLIKSSSSDIHFRNTGDTDFASISASSANFSNVVFANNGIKVSGSAGIQFASVTPVPGSGSIPWLIYTANSNTLFTRDGNNSRMFLTMTGGANSASSNLQIHANAYVESSLYLSGSGGLVFASATPATVGGSHPWLMYTANSSILYKRDITNNRMHVTYTQGASAATALTQFHSGVTIDGRLIASSPQTGNTLQATFTNTTSSQPAGFRLSNGAWDIGFRTNPSIGWFEITDSSGTIQHRWNAKDYLLSSTGRLYFSSESNYATSGTGAQDLSIGRSAAGVLRVYNSAGADGAIQAAAATFSGSITNITTKTYSLTRTLPATVGDYVDIGSFVFNNGAGLLDIAITVGLGGNSQTKFYKIPFYWSATTNNWRKYPSLSSSPTFSGNDFDLEVRSNTALHDLRIRKTAGSTGGDISISITQYGRVDIDTFTPSTSTGSGGAPTSLAVEFARENLVIRAIGGSTEDLLIARNNAGSNVARITHTGQFFMANAVEHSSIGDGLMRMYFNTSGTTIFRGHGSEIFIMQNGVGSNMMTLGNTGNLVIQGTATAATPTAGSNNTTLATTAFTNALWNNMGQAHATQTDFNSVTNFGFRYIQGNTNGPGTGSSQFYCMALGLGSEYAYSQFAVQLAIPRYNSSDKYLSMRTRESGTWGSWYKIAAGTADGLREFTWSGKPTASSTKGPIMITDTVPANTIWTSDGTVWRSQTRTRKTITYAATLTLDSSEAMVQRVTLTGNLTLNKFTNPFDGAALEVILRQDGVGGRTLTFGTGFRFNDYITSITLSTAANKTDRILFEYDAVDDVWDVISFVKGS